MVDPLHIDKIERETVRLILLDVKVLDRQDRTVAGLEPSDFEIRAGGKWREIDTLDARCDAGSLDDPRGVRDPARREPPPAGERGRKLVLAFDYEHLSASQRLDVPRSTSASPSTEGRSVALRRRRKAGAPQAKRLRRRRA